MSSPVGEWMIKIWTTYLKSAEELVVADSAVAIAVEIVHQVLGLLEWEVEAIVNEAPTEVLDVQLVVAIIIHGFEDARNALDAAGRALQNLGLNFSDQVFDREGLELLHRDRVASIGSIANEPDVLVVLELGGYISGNITLILQGQILRAIQNSKWVAHNFFFSTEIVGISLVVAAKVVAGSAVTQKNGIVASDGLTLSF